MTKIILLTDVVKTGDLIWTASSLHVYEYHFCHIEKLIEETTR